MGESRSGVLRSFHRHDQTGVIALGALVNIKLNLLAGF